MEELKQQLLADVAALKVEATQLNTKTLTKLNAAMEQSRSLKAWREQQNLRILEMQVSDKGNCVSYSEPCSKRKLLVQGASG